MSLALPVSGLLSPMATPRLAPSDLPAVPSTSPSTVPAPASMTRKQAREDRHLQYLEEERLDDERALRSITNQVITLRVPFETVKTEFEDLDGLSHSPPFSFSRPPIMWLDTAVSYPPAVPAHAAVRHYQSIPPLTPDATIRAVVARDRRAHLPAMFKQPGSPQLDSALTRKSTRRSASAAARRRASAERERMCRPGSSA
ncbi:hypothetical protein K488DRAFT_81491 [Vararia minispora EC-137]|uniref:Uncharacterized protein n=1 Tax=Vararia minispora EC-137 TaxID=1314806 RepID=A0ACB8QYV7_9AGAM|nr:hypothetical protein K488DRAFT_81491 [Vararia minispora EC-137]